MLPMFSVSVDIDSLDCYYRIHGLEPSSHAHRSIIYRHCVTRFAELFASLGIPATFFVVGRDVDVSARGDRFGDARDARLIISQLASQGHEISSHSYSHPYALASFERAEVELEIGRVHRVLSAITGSAPRGFRAPGYDLSPLMQAALIERGYLYDSSMFPTPGYYLAKAAIMAGMRLLGKPSGAVLTNPRALQAPAEPYRPSLKAPWRRGQAPLVELPIAVAPYSRIPVIGTSLLLAPQKVRQWLISAMTKREHFNFELHAIDLADAQMDGLPAELIARQPDLRVPLANKRRALLEILTYAKDHFEVRTLEQAALEFAALV